MKPRFTIPSNLPLSYRRALSFRTQVGATRFLSTHLVSPLPLIFASMRRCSITHTTVTTVWSSLCSRLYHGPDGRLSLLLRYKGLQYSNCKTAVFCVDPQKNLSKYNNTCMHGCLPARSHQHSPFWLCIADIQGDVMDCTGWEKENGERIHHAYLFEIFSFFCQLIAHNFSIVHCGQNKLFIH